MECERLWAVVVSARHFRSWRGHAKGGVFLPI
jgi:hypothetical protein